MRDDSEDRLLRWVAQQNAESIRLAHRRAERQAEATLWEQANLLNLTHDAIFVRDMNGVIRYWNRGAEELYGWTAEQAVGRVVHDLLKTVFPESLEQVEADVTRAGRWEGELMHTKKDGTQVVVASRWALQRDERGAPVAILATNNDITERRRAEQSLRESEAQWRAVFECNPTMYFIVNETGMIISVNTFGAEQLGYGVQELVGQPVLAVSHGPDHEFVQRKTAECFQQLGRTIRWEARKIRKDGSLLWARETASALVLKDRPVLLVVCEDITERKRAEEGLRRSEKELRDVIETIPAIAWIALPDGSSVFVNKRWTEYTGLSVEETAGSGWQAALHPEDVARHVGKWRASVATGEPLEDEARFRRAADGEYRWFLVRGVPLRDEHDNILKWYGILTDMEDRKRAEALLAGEKRILEMVAKGDSLPQILDSMCRLVEEQANGVLASILLLDGNRLRHGGAPNLPRAYTDAIDGAEIGPSAGSCGTAAYRAQQVIVEDIATDPLWADYRDLALPHSLRACWSTPVFSSQGKVIATFAMYYREPRRPSLRDQEIIEQITHLAGVAIQRKLTEEKLGKNETYLAEAQRLTHTGSWAYNPATWKPTYWSDEMFRIWGFSPELNIAPDLDARVARTHQEDRDRVRKRIDKAFREGIDYAEDYRIVLPDGTVKHLHAIGHPVFDEAGEIVEYVGTTVDVTERKRAEEALRRSEAYLTEAQRLSHTGSWAWDPSGPKVLYCSEETFRIFGLEPQASLPSHELRELILQRIHPEDRDRLVEDFKKALREKGDNSAEHTIELPDGTIKHIQVVRHAVLNDAGDVTEVVGTLIDVTERKRAEEEREKLRRLEADLAHINRVSMMGELDASLAHELNQPITAAVTNARTCLRWLTRDDPDLEEAREAARRIVNDGTRAAEIITRIRSLYTKRPPHREVVDVNKMAGEMLALLRNEATRHAISMRADLAADLPTVTADRVQLQQVFMNLMLNGIEAMKDMPGDLVITSQRTQDNHVLISVSDTGVGLPAAQADQIFSAFFTTKPEGTGMGLAISRSIIESHGGRLWATANTGRGATFHFTLPGRAAAS